MEENNKLIGNINTISENNLIGIKSDSSPFAESFYFSEIYDDKKVKKFIKNVERLIRSSKEYNMYIELLRTNVMALNHDSILGNITTEDVDMEFHHYPLSLYDIVSVIMLDNISKNKNFTSLSLAKQVMEEHFNHNIGLVPLTKTMHELAHSGNIFIKKEQIFGNYENFIKIHENGVSQEILSKLSNLNIYENMNISQDFKGLL